MEFITTKSTFLEQLKSRNEFLDIEVDNKYTLEHVISKLEKQTPELLINLINEEMQKF